MLVVRIKAQINYCAAKNLSEASQCYHECSLTPYPWHAGGWVTGSCVHLHPCLTVFSLAHSASKKETPKLLAFRGPFQSCTYLSIHLNHPFFQQILTES